MVTVLERQLLERRWPAGSLEHERVATMLRNRDSDAGEMVEAALMTIKSAGSEPPTEPAILGTLGFGR